MRKSLAASGVCVGLGASLAVLGTGGLAQAQDPASVTWYLTANTNVSATLGNAAGQPEQFSFSESDSSCNLVVRDYAATGGGQRVHLGVTNWPYETSENPGRYLQFAVSATPGKMFHISSLTLELGGAGTGAMNANCYWSTDSTFGERTKLNTTTQLPKDAWLDPPPVYALSVDIMYDVTFFVRIYPWYNSTNASTSKYILLRNIVISGVTGSGGMFIPQITTLTVSHVTSTSATCGGNVTWDGGATVTARGVCWNSTGSPTLSDPHTSDGPGSGSFSSALNGLIDGGQYHVRAYATNSVGTAYGQEVVFVAVDPPPPLLAFPGAEGWGKYTLGGRGGAVIEVTNLNDSGEGSLRAAIQAAGPRTVVFRVSGTILLNSNLTISNPSITIAGQTAPGDGICLRRYPLNVAADQVIIRYLRMRLGDESGEESDAFGGRWVSNLIIDHCSASWSVDETVSFYWCDNTTVQWCLISESLYNSNHPKGAHGYGGIWGGPDATYHHNLFAHHSSRNPRFASGVGVTDYRNNVIYNWGFNSAYGGEDTSDGSPVSFSNVNMVANYYRSGPATSSGRIRYRIVNPSTHAADITDSTKYGRWFVAGNVVDGYPNVSEDNWTLGVQPQSDVVKDAIRADTPFDHIPILEQSAGDAYLSVLDGAGATRPVRDTVDRRIVREVAASTATFTGATYPVDHPGVIAPCGIIDSQNDVGGWPVLNSLPAPADTDHDGMPDAWEIAHGLEPNNPDDRNGIGEGGYTNLENYLNSPDLLTAVAEESVRPTDLTLANYPNPFNPTTRIEFTVDKHGPASLQVYNVLGQLVADVFRGVAEKGKRHSVQFDARQLSSGMYFAVLEANGRRLTQQLILMK